MEYTLYDDGAPPETKEKGTLRRELLYVNFINSLRNRNPGAMEVIVPPDPNPYPNSNPKPNSKPRVNLTPTLTRWR